MAFTVKLTNMLAEATEVARADGADMVAFIAKDKGANGALTFANTEDPALLLSVASVLIEAAMEKTGISRKKLVKIMNKNITAKVIKEKRGINGRDIADLD